MYRWLATGMVRRALRRHQAGDVEGLLKTYAKDVRFVFPGRSSWSADLRGREALEPWLRRFHQAGLQLEVHEVLTSGPPWNTTVCVHFTDHAEAADGRVVYENRGVIFGKGAWGKLIYSVVYEDTQKVAEFDEYLATLGPGP